MTDISKRRGEKCFADISVSEHIIDISQPHLSYCIGSWNRICV